jgi:4-hydroxybenzoate polyprenyltransferase
MKIENEQRNYKFKSYLSLVKFSHTIFAMPFALIGFFLAVKYAGFYLEWSVLISVILCMVFARNAAMGYNRYVDREIDAKNERTANREIPKGVLKSKSVLAFVLLNSLAFIITTFFINKLVFFLSPIALAVILGYSFAKNFTYLCHFILGVGLALAPLGAFLAVTGEFNVLPILFSFIVLTWVSGFDIIYSLQDEDFDRGNELKSVPVRFGKKGALILSTIIHTISGVLVIFAGIKGEFGWIYYTGSAIFISLLFYQNYIVKPTDLSKVNIAFMTTNGVASVIYAIFTILDLYIIQ